MYEVGNERLSAASGRMALVVQAPGFAMTSEPWPLDTSIDYRIRAIAGCWKYGNELYVLVGVA